MKTGMNPSEKQPEFQLILWKIIKSIGIILFSAAGLILAFSIWLTVQLNIVRSDCTWMTFMCDMGEILYGSRQNCIVFHTAYALASDAEMARRGYTHKEHFICIDQKNHLRHRCYLPHFINRQYEKYQAKQRGEEFYGDAKDCRDIEVKKEEKK